MTREEFFNSLKNGAVWDVGVSINRTNPRPLDKNSVFETYADLETYAAGVLAYPGQVVAVVGESNTTIYYLDQNLAIKPVGVIPTGDNATVAVDASGKIGLANITDEKKTGTFNAVLKDGVLTWEAPDNKTIEGVQQTLNDLDTALKAEAKAREEGNTAIQQTIDAMYTNKEIDDAIDTAVKSILGEDISEAYNTLKEIQDLLEGTDAEAVDGLIEKINQNTAAINTINNTNFIDNSELTEILKTYAEISNVYTKEEANKAIEDALSTATGGESAADVLLALNNFKKLINAEIYGNEEGTGDSRIDSLAAVGAEKNVIVGVKVDNVDLTIDAERKVNIDLKSSLDPIATKAQKGVDDAKSAMDKAAKAEQDAANNASAITTLQTTVNTTHANAITTYGQDIANLKLADTNHKAEYEALVKALEEKATNNRVDGIVQTINQNSADLTTLKDTTIPAINLALDNKANKTDLNDYYTKAAIDSITGTVPADTNLVAMIDGAKYNDTDIKASIKKNTDALAILNGDVATAGSVKAEAKAAADVAIAAIVDSAPEAMDTLREVAEWIADDKTGAAAMSASISKNTSDIASIVAAETGILAQAKKYTDEQIEAIPAATADALGLVKYDNKTIKKDTTDHLYVAEVSTDLLVQGSKTLILNGGSADVETTTE